MPDPLAELTSLAEDAISDIRLLVHDYKAARRTPSVLSGLGRFATPHTAFGDRATQLAIANITGVVEQYVETVLLGSGHAPNAVTTWPRKITAWNSTFTVDVEKESPSFTRMWGFCDARNSIMHARGELTSLQRKDARVGRRLAAAGISRIGYNLVVTEEIVDDCATTCICALQELDEIRP